MRPLLLKTFIALALTAPGLALADPPALVGRISLAEGQVALATDGNQDAGQALLNWPVTNDSRIVTERGALAEFRVGAAAVRLAADSELEVTRLDDDNFRLRLNYGSAAVRIVDPEMLRGFELRTDLARVTLTQPGWLRVDARRDMSVVGVLAGRAEVEGGGSSTTIEPGRRAEIGVDDLHLGALRRDAFDNWPQLADTPALRYVSQSVTGYEELDRYGNWRVDPDYGALWQPRELPSGWAPYRYGRWTFLQPWGWTWVDDAPWGYAPSHYGRWVLVGQRWSWAPGRMARPAWSPALVGWVGGALGQVPFAARGGRHSGPGVGWFPLSPRDTYAPAYRVSPEHRRRLDWRHDGAGPRRGAPPQERA
ncbi:MAG: hypothetical protein H7Z39_13835, partial [Burkholderiaceae bacterium]|nr:hypothetical protein [Burkholderiaceae bacterium]